MLPAAVGSLLAVVIVAFVTVLGYLPLYASDGRRERDAPYCIVVGFLMFNSLSLFWPDLVPRRCSRHANLFLDKSCIHQVDLDLQRAGIESIGALFVELGGAVLPHLHAEGLDVLRDGMLLAPPSPRPSRVASRRYRSCGSRWFGRKLVLHDLGVHIAVHICEERGPDIKFRQGGVVLAVCSFLCRRVSRDHAHSIADLQSFSIRAAICTVESDRITVEDNVVCLMLYLKYVPSHCTREDALNAVDLMVRREMPRKIRASTGRFLLRYEYVTPMALPMLLGTFDVACAHLVTGASVRQLVSSSVEMLARSLTALPLCLAVNMWLSGLFHKLCGLKETLYNLFAGMANFFTGTLLYFLLRLLQTNAVDDDMHLVLLCLCSAGLVALTYLVFRRPPGKVYRRRTGRVVDPSAVIAEVLDGISPREESFPWKHVFVW